MAFLLKNWFSHHKYNTLVEDVNEAESESTEYSYSVKYTWRIPNFSRINTDYLYSDVFAGGGHKWKIKIYPKGCIEGDNFAILLCVADPKTLPNQWSRHVKYSLSLICEIDDHTIKDGRDATFSLHGVNQGFKYCIDRDKLHLFLVNDTITIRAEVWFNEEQGKEQPNIKVESSSSFAEFETLFTDLQNHLQEKIVHNDDEIANAQAILNKCLSMDVTSFIRSGKVVELKNALSLLLTAKAIPDSKVDETAKFVAHFDEHCEKYEAAKQDLNKAREDEVSVGELKTALNQIFLSFVSLRNQIEAVDSEMSRQEKLLAGSKAKRVRLRKKLSELTQQATTSKEALVCAEKGMKVSAMKKEEADKTVNELYTSWESLKDILSVMK